MLVSLEYSHFLLEENLHNTLDITHIRHVAYSCY